MICCEGMGSKGESRTFRRQSQGSKWEMRMAWTQMAAVKAVRRGQSLDIL